MLTFFAVSGSQDRPGIIPIALFARQWWIQGVNMDILVPDACFCARKFSEKGWRIWGKVMEDDFYLWRWWIIRWERTTCKKDYRGYGLVMDALGENFFPDHTGWACKYQLHHGRCFWSLLQNKLDGGWKYLFESLNADYIYINGAENSLLRCLTYCRRQGGRCSLRLSAPVRCLMLKKWVEYRMRHSRRKDCIICLETLLVLAWRRLG